MPIARLLAGAAPVSSDDDLSSPRGIGDFAALVSHSVEEIGSSSSTGTNPRQDTASENAKERFNRRPIEPPPILKLEGVELSRGPSYILFSTLWSLFVFSLGASFSGD
ncbi:hypothetical protein BDR26DRAFT_1010433 [Obelidium mucronatum]|nr:hypothetical protein BDR26DRAFT_1010433 [Obelidium mucronatum]